MPKKLAQMPKKLAQMPKKLALKQHKQKPHQQQLSQQTHLLLLKR